MTFVCRVAVISLGFVRSSLFMLKEESSNEMTDCTKKNLLQMLLKREDMQVCMFLAMVHMRSIWLQRIF